MARAAAVIRAGGLVAFPTDTMYGLAADPFNPSAVRRIVVAKGRPSDRAMPLVAADMAQVAEQIGPLTPLARRLADRFWPGPLTIIMPAPLAIAAGVSAGTGRVGVRVPAHAVARDLSRSSASVLVATSANPSGQAAPTDPDDIAAPLVAAIDMLIDSGPTPGGPPSTIIDVTTIVDATGAAVQLVRAGAISWEDIDACLRDHR
ncbi:MAG: threonylcarbamoyl-AMP synthase [Acidobacteria bacterium RIFCSPLOWO2_02_FULL_65_29]|nr:MAG: threonylcarbamoyl-AMP synthase [Acidobacteria bacterium RIFCSPLOWO2_02_FULL_65_29]